MSLASAAGALLKPQTPLQQLLEDINFQRTKEMRQLLKDDSGFVVLQGTTYWTDLFVRHFLFQSEPAHSIDSDDLLFFVRKKHVKSSSRHMPKYETEVDVFRKDSRKLPIGDPDVDWEETVYLNMVIHQFDYTLTLAICTRTSPKELQVLRRHSQRVYASPSRRKMDTKGEGEEMTYPHICFMVDNFDEVFSDILVRDGEMVCVELVANDKDGSVQGVIFLGSIRYDALKKVYDSRQSSLSSKVAQRMSFGLFSSGAGVQTRCEFVRMKGPQGKGHAEMAVTKPKGSGVETPTSEPGFCATDMWDDWDEDNDDYCTYRHQRRLSDPSANLNNFSRYAWRTKNAQDAPSGSAGSKARSENEGLDSLASEVSEIEAGDLRDDQGPAFSASETKLHCNLNCDIKTSTLATAITTPSAITTKIETVDTVDTCTITSPNSTSTGCNCFGGKGKKCKRWPSSSSSAQMSEIYCPTCEDPSNETPACLNKMPDKKLKPKHKTILSVESELIVGKASNLLNEPKPKRLSRSISLTPTPQRPSSTDKNKKFVQKKTESQKNEKLKTREKVTVKSAAKAVTSKMSPKRTKSEKKTETKKKIKDTTVNCNNNDAITTTLEVKEEQEYEIADDATSLNGGELTNNKGEAKIAILSEQDTMLMISVRGKEELPVVEEPTSTSPMPSPTSPLSKIETTTTTKHELISICHPYCFEKCVPVKSESHPLQLSVNENVFTKNPTAVANNIDNNDSQELLTEVFENTPMLGGNDCNGNCDDNVTTTSNRSPCTAQPPQTDDDDGITSDSNGENFKFQRHSTLPRIKKASTQQTFYNRALNLVPKRRTPDGTNIYYWCDLSEKALKELDDGAYNPLWASRGFTQTFHFWKESRRQQSTPLNAFLTYVTLPWWSIAKDLLDHRETPILTF